MKTAAKDTEFFAAAVCGRKAKMLIAIALDN